MSDALNTLTDEQRDAGWRLLFDGRTPDGWRGYRQPDFPAGWRIVDGTIHRADDAPDIITVDQFASFELALEWKHADRGNSGIIYRVTEDHEASWHTGPEYQVLNDAAHEGLKPEQLCGANYDLHAPSEAAAKPEGEWNETRIVVRDRRVEHWLNGVNVVSYELLSEDWERRVAASKFARFPKYGRNPAGHIALQSHGDPVWYRNIKLREL